MRKGKGMVYETSHQNNWVELWLLALLLYTLYIWVCRCAVDRTTEWDSVASRTELRSIEHCEEASGGGFCLIWIGSPSLTWLRRGPIVWELRAEPGVVGGADEVIQRFMMLRGELCKRPNSGERSWCFYFISIAIFYLVKFQVGCASEVEECCRGQRPPWRDHSHLMRYSVMVHNHHTESAVTEWTSETTPSVNVVLLACAKSPVRMTQAKPVRVIFSTWDDAMAEWSSMTSRLCNLWKWARSRRTEVSWEDTW